MIYIIIPVFNRISFTLACLRSLSTQTYSNFVTIIVNDGSTDGTDRLIKESFPAAVVMNGDGNLWWTGSTNLGVKKALELSASQNDCILTLNNDLVVKEDYLEKLINAGRLHPHTLIGSVSVNIDEPLSVHYAGTKWNSRTASYRPVTKAPVGLEELQLNSTLLPTDLLPGRGVLIPVAVFSKIGLYDSEFFPHYMGDEDFALRAKKAGYSLGIATHAVVYNHVRETGLQNQKKGLKYYWQVFTSKKSPANSVYRWNWAKRHAAIPAPIYFALDLMRIFKSLIFK